MERRIRSRITAFILLIAMIVSIYSFRVYQLQTSEEVQMPDPLTYYTNVTGSRGQVLDRNGTVLVTNRASYEIGRAHV